MKINFQLFLQEVKTVNIQLSIAQKIINLFLREKRGIALSLSLSLSLSHKNQINSINFKENSLSTR